MIQQIGTRLDQTRPTSFAGRPGVDDLDMQIEVCWQGNKEDWGVFNGQQIIIKDVGNSPESGLSITSLALQLSEGDLRSQGLRVLSIDGQSLVQGIFGV